MTALAFPKHKRVVNPRYLARVRALPCYAHSLGECGGRIEAHHKTGAGLAIKADDTETMPLCVRHHREFHAGTGPVFEPMVKHERRAFEAAGITWTKRQLTEGAA